MESWAVVVAGGTGARFGGPKQFAELAGRRVVDWSLDAARQACDGVVLVVPGERTAEAWNADFVAPAGDSRSQSVRSGLGRVPQTADVIVVHDAARPLARLELWRSVIGALADGADAAIPSVPVTDTVKEIGPDGRLTTLDRSSLVAVQTPQGFRARTLIEVHRSAGEATDDAALVEAAGGRVVLVPGPRDNIKITCPEDLHLAAALLGVRE
jgi:2-C-methyl-D-erythritol 4-phosphate cytidylyltransferase